jgi:hypothetical protein
MVSNIGAMLRLTYAADMRYPAGCAAELRQARTTMTLPLDVREANQLGEPAPAR